MVLTWNIRMTRSHQLGTVLGLLLALTGCSGGQNEAPSPIILCAAEALKAARNPSASSAEQDQWRATVSLLEEKLPQAQHNDAHSVIERLADENAATPLIAPARCEAMLTEADRAALMSRRL